MAHALSCELVSCMKLSMGELRGRGHQADRTRAHGIRECCVARKAVSEWPLHFTSLYISFLG